MNDPSIYRIMILGFDGATWSLLQPWIESGILPGFMKASQMGVKATLLSSTPPYSAPAWATFATGMNPGKHGIADFWQPTPDGRGVQLISSHSLAVPAIWSLLSQAGKRMAVINVPGTYPPREINGIMISGMMTPSEEAQWTYPHSLKNELISLQGGYAANPYATATQSKDFLRKVLDWVPRRETIHQKLLEQEDWDLFINVVQASDPIQHHFWNMMDGTHPDYDPVLAEKYAPLLMESYAAMDAVLLDRLKRVDEHTALLVMSDHGFGPAQKYVHINRLLAEMGLLQFQDQNLSAGSMLQRGGYSMSAFYKLIRRLDPWNMRGRLSNRVRHFLRRKMDQVLAAPIDWARTKAYAGRSTGEAIYINLRGRDPQGIIDPGEAYEHIRDQIITALENLRDPETGEKVISQVWRKEEIYQGPQLPILPDILFQISPYPYLPTDRLSVDSIFERIDPSVGGGRHYPEGIFMGVGGPFRQGVQVDSGLHISDIAPIVLHLLGMEIPEDMDGRVCDALFEPSYLIENPVRIGSPVSEGDGIVMDSPYTKAEMEMVEENLRKLGYL